MYIRTVYSISYTVYRIYLKLRKSIETMSVEVFEENWNVSI